MDTHSLFVKTAQQHGFSIAAAYSVLDFVESNLSEQGSSRETRFYVYRTGGGAGEAADGSERSRLLLAFPSADAALAFAQHYGLGPSPRLHSIHVDQLLTILLQRPAIGTLLFVDELAENPPGRHVPPGLQVYRSVVLAMLQGR